MKPLRGLNYTIPRNNRELQRKKLVNRSNANYTIPRNNRELQLFRLPARSAENYTIPRNNRELQRLASSFTSGLIIPYQEIIGNYSIIKVYQFIYIIIPYQEIIGNYSLLSVGSLRNSIIPYQEITGNYSCQGWYGILESLSIPQNKKIPLLRII